ncbi:DUF3558 family protein [Actinokineospora sp. NPDC004072]
MRAVGLLVLVVLTGCGAGEAEGPVPSPPSGSAPPPVAGVAPLLVGAPCELVDQAMRRELGVDVAGVPYTERGAWVCRWEREGMAGVGLGVSVEAEVDPLAGVRGQRGALAGEVGGFPAIELAGEHVCDVYVQTAPDQGFSVVYGALDRVLDACGGARKVAESLAARVREG